LFNEEERTQKTPRSHQKNENGLNLKMIKCARRVKKNKGQTKNKEVMDFCFVLIASDWRSCGFYTPLALVV
jgi:hypothetical protein